ncbi:MAG: biopolymer transporter ExbD [Kiritimatiellae bacterium]|nr:biopolymer transporter ExbD [Kiritimatiellia bacterium]
MRIRRSQDADEEFVNTTSLVDILFILIIFFLLTTTFHEQERDIKVNLPDTDASRTLSSAVKVLVVNVRKDGSYYMGSRRMTVVDLRQTLSAAARENPKQKVLIRGDREALHGYVAAAIAACKRSGIHEANIGYVIWGAGQ